MTRGSQDRNQTRFKKKIIAKHGLRAAPAGDPPGMRKLTDAELETLCRPFLEAEKNRIEESLRDDVCPDIVDLLALVPEDHPARPAVESLASFFADFMPKPGDAPAPTTEEGYDISEGILSLASKVLTREAWDTWTLEQRTAAVDWAAATHLSASDNDNPVPPCPAWVAALADIGGGDLWPVELDEAEAPPAPEAAP